MVKEGFRPGGQRTIAIPPLLCSASPSGFIRSICLLTCRCWGQQTPTWYVVPVYVSLGLVRWQRDWVRGSLSLLIQVGGPVGEGRASSELLWDSELGYQHSCPPRHDPCGVARVPVRDFLFLILIVLLLNSLELRTSFLWDREHENPRASPGEVMHIN